MQDLNEGNFQDNVSEGNAVVDFWAPWCGPCKVLGPKFESVSKQHDDVNFFKLNVDEEADLAQRFGVRSIPTIVFFKDGEPEERVTGAMSEEKLNSLVEQVYG